MLTLCLNGWYDGETWDNTQIVFALKVTLFVLLGAALIFAWLAQTSYAVNKSTDARAESRSFVCMKLGLWIVDLLLLSLALFYIKQLIDDEAQKALYVGMRVLSFVLAGVIGIGIELATHREKKTADTREITFAAVCIALSFALSCIKLWEMPQGGSVTLGRLLPLAVYCFYFGFKRGLLACFVYSMLELLQDPWIFNWWQVLLDYTVPFTGIAIVGCFGGLRKKIGKWAIFVGMTVYSCFRFLCHLVTGALVFAELGGYQNWAWLYSAGYNSVVFIDLAISLALGLFLFSTNYFPRYMERFVAGLRTNRTAAGNKAAEDQACAECALPGSVTADRACAECAAAEDACRTQTKTAERSEQ